MKVLVTGANGILGHYLIPYLLKNNYHVIATGKGNSRLPLIPGDFYEYHSMDFTDPFAVHDVFELYKPDAVVHAGAMTQVDFCETNQWDAYVTNVEGTVTMLLNAEAHKSFFVFISTDFVFSGEKGGYREEDGMSPVNHYGKTKAEGEEAVYEYEYDWAVVRTSLVYGANVQGRNNIISVIRQKLEEQSNYNIVNDQVRSPTYVGSLAAGIELILAKRANGIYHLSGNDILTPYHIATAIAAELKLDQGVLHQVDSSTFSQPAKRPLKTYLDITKAQSDLNYLPSSFEEGLKATIEELNKNPR